MLNLLLMYSNLTTYFASMKNMEKNLLTCWMACSLLFSSTPGTKASLQLGMLSVLRHYIWAGVLMVINFFSFFLFYICWSHSIVVQEDNSRDLSCIFPLDLLIAYCTAGSIWFGSEMKALSDDCERFISFPPGHIYSSKQGLQIFSWESWEFLRLFSFMDWFLSLLISWS